MDNKKIINTAKILDLLANVGGKIAGIIGIVCVLLAFFTLILGDKMFSQGAFALDLDFIKFHFDDSFSVNEKFIKLYSFIGTLGGGLICFFIYYISTVLHKILSPMSNGRPFEIGISENLRKIGWAILICGCISELLGVIARVLLVNAYPMTELFTSAAITKIEYLFTIDLNFAFITIVIFLLSYIFTYGQKLQQDSDETL